jgi:quercetin dioxygenase-like cupin family protein
VQRQQNADGSVSVVREKWPIIRPDFLSAHVHYEPGMVVRRHGHRSNHIVFVLGGSGWIGTEPCEPGTHIHVPLGSAFGPIIAGPEGLTCWELSFGEFGGWGDQPELYANEIAERSITPLPDPPLEIGDWFVDPRGDWGGERPSPKVDGLQSVMTHVRDYEWTEVKQQQNADGSVSVVREKSFVRQPDFTSTYVEYSPGMTVQRHGYFGQHLVWVIEGGAWFGDRWCPAGTHIELPLGAAFGPIVAGVEGALLLQLTDGEVGT